MFLVININKYKNLKKLNNILNVPSLQFHKDITN